MAFNLVMFNSDHRHHHQAFSSSFTPRISFSSDFLESGEFIHRHESTASVMASPAEDSNFEFCVSNYSMLTADQLFHQGRILPFKGDNNKTAVTTLRDELSSAEQDDEGAARAATWPTKGSRKWKKVLGFRKSATKKLISHVIERVEERDPFRTGIDVRDERKMWGWREEQGSYGWYVRDKREIDDEEERERRRKTDLISEGFNS